MLKKFLGSFLLAFHNIRSHFFHTLLSVLGIVIGVASLVAILSLIDGMEDYAKEQITKTTSLNAILVHTQAYHKVNGVRMKRDSFPVVTFRQYEELKRVLQKPAKVYIRSTSSGLIQMENDGRQLGAMIYGIGSVMIPGNQTTEAGNVFSDENIRDASPYAIVNSVLANAIDSVQPRTSLIGQRINMKGLQVSIVAILNDGATEPRIAIPITLISDAGLHDAPPELSIEAEDVRDVQALKATVIEWLEQTYGDKDSFAVATNDARVAQATKGFLLFRIIMGLIVGISVVVGGIGIMNVLLISITERTVEIGIRKAVGANRRDIIFQFLAESITVSAFGSLVGLALGIAITSIAVPIVKALTDIPFYAIYTWNTLLVTSVLAIVLGIVFGTYPAMRAARLDPVDAIRRE